MENNFLIHCKITKNILNDMREIIEVSRKSAYQAVNVALVYRNWLIGKRITQEELNNKTRAQYGLEIIKQLSESLTKEYGKGFTKSNLYSFYSFYKLFPNIFQTVFGKSDFILSWSHYFTLLRVKDSQARNWYAKESSQQNWAVRTLLKGTAK